MMTEKSIQFRYKEFEKREELDPSDLELLNEAGRVAANAYAPYSEFRVGAAIRLKSGRIVTGTNVENAAFPSGICAERSALSNASSNYPGDIPVTMAVAALPGKGFSPEPVSPCGNCRQVIAEEEYRNKKNIRIILGGKEKVRIIESGGALLPLQFNNECLKVNPLKQ